MNRISPMMLITQLQDSRLWIAPSCRLLHGSTAAAQDHIAALHVCLRQVSPPTPQVRQMGLYDWRKLYLEHQQANETSRFSQCIYVFISRASTSASQPTIQIFAKARIYLLQWISQAYMLKQILYVASHRHINQTTSPSSTKITNKVNPNLPVDDERQVDDINQVTMFDL